MSPGMNAAWPWLLDLFGGRQSARSIHFINAWALVAFFIVHIAMVLLAGPMNEIRTMVTGWFRLPPEKDAGTASSTRAANPLGAQAGARKMAEEGQSVSVRGEQGG